MAIRKSWVSRLFLLAAFFGALALLAYLHTQRFAHQPLELDRETALFTVDKGDGLNKILPKMRAAGIDQGADWQWKALAMQMGMASRIHLGDYRISRMDTPAEVLRKLAVGDTARIKFTIIEGWNFKQLMQQLKDLPEPVDDVTSLSPSEIMVLVGKQGMHPEGRFLPDTYFVPLSGKKSQILIDAAAAMDIALAEAWTGRDKALPLQSAEQLLVLASIVEKETGQAHERPQIAGVFVRRLQANMRLQTDPTVIYGMADAYRGNISKQDLRRDTLYNTYTRAGLPPTPIAMPGRAALTASAHPAGGDALYFVAMGNGEHLFSASYDEHRKAVQTYQKKQ
ncbi:MAG: endolytic transglycosylase MltG [Arenimonas sp.]|nr:endolytic transglycosylase MltG [Arenimonas sp.]MBP7981600.1 endolytic transglycosylase MltG [Arenimonas sp.]